MIQSSLCRLINKSEASLIHDVLADIIESELHLIISAALSFGGVAEQVRHRYDSARVLGETRAH